MSIDRNNNNNIMNDLLNQKRIVIIQDLDGVCIPLVKDPLTRKLDKEYIKGVRSIGKEYAVLTNGEHEGLRGVNRLVEAAIGSKDKVKDLGLYLPGLAAGGIEYQDKFGNASHHGVSQAEIDFLSSVPNILKTILKDRLQLVLNMYNVSKIDELIKSSIISNTYSPTLNLNRMFSEVPSNVQIKRELQSIFKDSMQYIIELSKNKGLGDSFFLHIAPNLGKESGEELIKYANDNDIGTTDIQLLIKGSIKESGLLVLLNKYVGGNTGIYPFGREFNVRDSPEDIGELVNLCKAKIARDDMPTIVGVGDTVTSNQDPTNKKWRRGGSDRGFLQLIQDLGKSYKIDNKVFLVDSSFGEVERPSLNNNDALIGISDAEDPLKFDALFRGGPKDYINWFLDFAKLRAKH